MKLNLKKWTGLDTCTIVLSIIQIIMLMFSGTDEVNVVNNVAFYNNYILISLIMASLIIRGGAEHFLAIMFFLCFFIFLMGQKLFMKEKNVFLTFSRTELNSNQFVIFVSIIFIGIVITYLSYLLACDNDKRLKNNVMMMVSNYSLLQPVIKVLYLCTLPCAVYMQIKVVVVRSALSYTAGYLINVEVPTVIKIGYYLFSSFTLLYLAIKPPKRDVYFIIITLLVLEGGVQLLQGRRAFFASTLFFVIWYLIKYYKIEVVHLTGIIGIILGGILLIVLFFFIEMQRSDINIGKVHLSYIIQKFMVSTGGSDSVIGNTIAHGEDFPKAGIWYLIDPIINNPISVILSGKSGISQGSQYLQNFNNFSHWISYLTERSLYSSGHGMGSSYLAEIYLAFGLIGVIIISIFLGKIIHIVAGINLHKNLFKTTIAFLLVRNLFTLPRSGLFSWFGDFTYMIVAFCIIYPFYSVYCKKVVIEEKTLQ